MLVLAILSTVILGLIVLLIFGAMVAGGFESTEKGICTIVILLIIFVIVTIWVLYAR